MKPTPDPSKVAFWIGNGVLAIALLMLFFMNTLAARLGMGAFVAWAVLAAIGVSLVMKDKRDEPPL